ncbi:MAG: UbiH/UbiF family hydroxylase [Pseudomonadota bacterium]|nr:UbiH/UbiF family hydroxylase [Pseudomonadota bacterium]
MAVIGAGPAGLTAAVALANMGCHTILAGPAYNSDPARPDTRTTALLGPSVQLLKNLRIWPDCEPAAAPLAAIRILDATGRALRAPEVVFHASELGSGAFGYNIPNSALVAALLHRAECQPGLQLISTKGATDVLPCDDGVDVQLAEGVGICARLIAACDGRNSICRRAAGIGAREWRYEQTAIACNFDHSLPHEGISNEFHTTHGPFTTVPLPGRSSSLVWVARTEEAQRLMALPDDRFAAEIERRTGPLLGTVTRNGPRSAFPLSGLTPEKFAARRIALVGEAAHVIPPIGAQGLNMGFRDAAILADLAGSANRTGDPGMASVMAAYDAARRGDVTSRTFAIDIVNRSLLSGLLPIQAARGAGLHLLNSVGPLRRFVMRQGLSPQSGIPPLMRAGGVSSGA